MKTMKFADEQIMFSLRQAEAGTPVSDLFHVYGISYATFYYGPANFGGIDVSIMARLKEHEEENRRFRKLYAEERLKADILNAAITKKW